MTELSADTDAITILRMVGDIEVPCDWQNISFHEGNAPAKWIVSLTPCACGRGGQRLICDTCKDAGLVTDGAATCSCGNVVHPWRLVMARIEAL